jgi:hypothetical protein
LSRGVEFEVQFQEIVVSVALLAVTVVDPIEALLAVSPPTDPTLIVIEAPGATPSIVFSA